MKQSHCKAGKLKGRLSMKRFTPLIFILIIMFFSFLPGPGKAENIKNETKDASSWNDKGIELHNKGKYEEAITCYDKAIKLDPHYVYAWYNKGLALYDQRKYKESLKCYDRALELDPVYTDAWNNRGLVFYEEGKYKEK